MEAVQFLEQQQGAAKANAQVESPRNQRQLPERDPNAPVLGSPMAMSPSSGSSTATVPVAGGPCPRFRG